MEEKSGRTAWLRGLATLAALLVATLAVGVFLLSRADGPVAIFAGGPLRSGEQVSLADINWNALDALRELELEIVGEGRSRTLWFSVHEVVRAGRARKYSGEGGARAAAETAAHDAVVEVGETLTGRSKSSEPGDRLYRVDPR